MAEYVNKKLLLNHWVKLLERSIHGTLSIETLKHDLENMPNADVTEIKHGHWRDDIGEWIEGERNAPEYITGQLVDKFACSWCGYTMYYKTPYCPNCGTPMDEKLKCPITNEPCDDWDCYWCEKGQGDG